MEDKLESKAEENEEEEGEEEQLAGSHGNKNKIENRERDGLVLREAITVLALQHAKKLRLNFLFLAQPNIYI